MREPCTDGGGVSSRITAVTAMGVKCPAGADPRASSGARPVGVARPTRTAGEGVQSFRTS